MIAILEFPAPESCCGEKKCSLIFDNPIGMNFCVKIREIVSDYTTSRHPDCPLRIEEEDENVTDDWDSDRDLCPEDW